MEKFPVRMKDNDLLVTELFQDPFKEEVTALSIFMPPNCCEFCCFMTWQTTIHITQKYSGLTQTFYVSIRLCSKNWEPIFRKSGFFS